MLEKIDYYINRVWNDLEEIELYCQDILKLRNFGSPSWKSQNYLFRKTLQI